MNNHGRHTHTHTDKQLGYTFSKYAGMSRNNQIDKVKCKDFIT